MSSYTATVVREKAAGKEESRVEHSSSRNSSSVPMKPLVQLLPGYSRYY